MAIHLPPARLLTKSLARQAAVAVDHLNKAQIVTCIEVLSGVSLAPAEKRQSKAALIQILSAAVKLNA